MFYGGMIWYVFPKVDETISWEGHLGGLLTGFFLAVLLKTPEYGKVIKYDWEKPDYDLANDKFMQRFDEKGNFVNLPIPEIQQETYFYSSMNINYQIVENAKNESDPEI